MISKIGQVMLYVNNQDEAVNFWRDQVGFNVVSDENDGQGVRWIEIAPSSEGTSFVLHDKKLIASMEPELNLGTPSIMFYTSDVEALYEDYKSRGITVGPLVQLRTGSVFNFADAEGNYFAVMQQP